MTRTAPAGDALAGRRALISGASGGIGAATAHLLHGLGVRVALTGRSPRALAALEAELDGSVAIESDLTVAGAPADVVARAVDALGGLDLVVSNAGAGWAGPFQAMTGDDIDDVFAVNLISGVHLVHAAVPHLVANRTSHVVLVGSIAGLLPVRGEAAYSAAKAGLAAMGESLAAELRTQGVRVATVHPGVVDTAFFERRNIAYARSRPRPIPPSDVAASIVDCVLHDRPGRVVPAWLAIPVRLRGTSPRLYRCLARQFG